MPASYVWTPSPAVIDRSNVNRFITRNGINGYRELIERSTERIEWFWEAVVEDLGISFSRPYDQILDASRGIAWPRWFIGGCINLAANCVDRHAESGGRDRMAVIAETETGVVRQLCYAELHDETCRLSNGLRSLGIGVGDAVGLFLPMVPEAVIAFMACEIGAVAVPIFSGFGSQAVAVRLADAGAKAIVTMDATSRRGRPIPMESVAAEAAQSCPDLKHLIVARRSRGRGVGDASGSCPRRVHLPWPALCKGRKGRASSIGISFWRRSRRNAPRSGSTRKLPLMIAYTSGTTGRPKGAVHVHGGFLVKIAQEVAHQVDMQRTTGCSG